MRLISTKAPNTSQSSWPRFRRTPTTAIEMKGGAQYNHRMRVRTLRGSRRIIAYSRGTGPPCCRNQSFPRLRPPLAFMHQTLDVVAVFPVDLHFFDIAIHEVRQGPDGGAIRVDSHRLDRNPLASRDAREVPRDGHSEAASLVDRRHARVGMQQLAREQSCPRKGSAGQGVGDPALGLLR